MYNYFFPVYNRYGEFFPLDNDEDRCNTIEMRLVHFMGKNNLTVGFNWLLRPKQAVG